MFFLKCFNKLLFIASGLWMRVMLALVGIKVRNARFLGIMRFSKEAGSSMTIGDGCEFRSYSTSNLIGINRPCIISTLTSEANLVIEEGCGFSGTVIGCFLSIHLGKNVRCGANTLITDSDWHTDDYRSGSNRAIVIDDNVWIGEGAKILKGVHVGMNTVIGAGSVVTKDIPANVIAAGNPCRVLKSI